MTIDLSTDEELEWLERGSAPPIRYSEIADEDTVFEEAKTATAKALSPKLRSRLTSVDRDEFTNLDTRDFQLVAVAIVYLIDDEEFAALSQNVQRRARTTAGERDTFLEVFLDTLTAEILDRIPPIRVRLIARYLAAFSDIGDNDHGPGGLLAGGHRNAEAESLCSNEEFEQAIAHLHEKGIDRIHVNA